MKVGPCGIVCTICRYYSRGLCEGCVRGDLCPPTKALLSPCPILRCAAAKKIPYCARDCSNFPCPFFEDRFPRCWSQMAASHQEPPSLDNEMLTRPAMSGSTLNPRKPGEERLRVFCLGPFHVYRGLAEIPDQEWGQGKGPTRKIKAMFAYLLARKEDGARKESLIDLLWPEQTEPERTSSVFHLTLHCLRRALEPDLKSMAGSSCIRYENGRYYFKPGKGYWFDADVFEFYCRRAVACNLYGDVEVARLYWGMALELYRGAYMVGIDGTYTENRNYDWCTTSRQHLQDLYLKALLEMTDYYYNEGKYSLCLECARKVLDHEPYNESVHRLVIQCLLKSGQLESAKHQYRLCKAELARSETREPCKQTQQLYERITAGITD